MISGSGSGWILLNSPKRGGTSMVGAVPLLWKLVTGWNIGQQLLLTCLCFQFLWCVGDGVPINDSSGHKWVL